MLCLIKEHIRKQFYEEKYIFTDLFPKKKPKEGSMVAVFRLYFFFAIQENIKKKFQNIWIFSLQFIA